MALTLTNDILKFRESTSDPWEKLLIQANMNFNLIYPVGSIYMSTVNVDPGTIFGGTWEQLKDTFLLGAGDNYTAGDTGGEATHTLTENEMPSHTHGVKANSSNSEASGYGLTQSSAFVNRVIISRNSADITTTSTGSGGAHNNMPPYLVVYMWRRLTLSPTIYTPPASVLIGEVASEDIVPIAKGGTGADNLDDARTNLGILSQKFDFIVLTGTTSKTVTRPSWANWLVVLKVQGSNYYQTTINVNGVSRTFNKDTSLGSYTFASSTTNLVLSGVDDYSGNSNSFLVFWGE